MTSLEDRLRANREVLAALTAAARTATTVLDQVGVGLRELDKRVHWLNRAIGAVYVLVGLIALIAGAAGGMVVALLR